VAKRWFVSDSYRQCAGCYKPRHVEKFVNPDWCEDRPTPAEWEPLCVWCRSAWVNVYLKPIPEV
jgi:hypothetical protein